MKQKYIIISLLCFQFVLIYMVNQYALENNLYDVFQLSENTCREEWYYIERFDDKHIKNNKILDVQNNTIWTIHQADGHKNGISDTGALQLGGSRYMQYAVLEEKQWDYKQDYAMEFTVNIQNMGNEGNPERPIIMIIPRTKDSSFNEYYAVTYYMENTNSNLFRFKWAIINTSAPTKMQPLAEGYYLLKENTDYTARLFIENTEENNVSIKFYIDSPENPVEDFKPLIEYTDSSPYKILKSAKGPAFGTVGYIDAAWGTSPVVRYDTVKLYEPAAFKAYALRLHEYSLIKPIDIMTDKAYKEIRYLINNGILSTYPDQQFHPEENVTVEQFIKMLIRLKGEKLPSNLLDKNEFSDYNKPITKYQAALLINLFTGNSKKINKKYLSVIRDVDDIPDKYRGAVLYAFYEGYLRLNEQFEFSGHQTITRSECASILVRMLDPGKRKINFDLELPNILSSGAVLQRNKKIPVWGRGVCGEPITVKFKHQIKTTVVKDGYWYLELDPEPQGGPYEMTVSSLSKHIVLKNIKVGEVFIVAGQSNAEMMLSECSEGTETRNALKNNPNLRFYWGEKSTAVTPRFNSPGKWMLAQDYVLDCSPAIGTFFAQKLLEINKELKDVTIGIIRMTYGGTTIEAFIPDSIMKEKNYTPKDDQPIMSGFWNGYMDAISPYSVKGAIYYQGENSTHLFYQYESLLRDYLRGLRMEFQDMNLPIILVQLSGYGNNSLGTDKDGWPYIREIQMRVANTTNHVGLVTAIDLPDPNPKEIHPKEKKKIGERLALLAMNMIYGQNAECNSPEMKSYKIKDNRVIIEFAHVYDSIKFKDNVAKGFEVLDNQGKWRPAQARIISHNAVEVWSDQVETPKGARYAWYNYPDVSLFSTSGLPALPFNTTKKIR